jgi:integrase
MPEYRLTRLRGKLAVTWTDSGGSRRRISTGESDPVAATRFAERMFAELRKPKDATIASILDHHIAALAGRSSEIVAGHQAKAIKAGLGNLLPSQVTPDRISAYVSARQAAGRKPATIRSEVILLSSALNRAVRDRLISERPLFETPANSPPRDLHLTRDEFARLKQEAASHHIALFLELAIATGARSAAILDLTWNRVDFARGQIDLRLNKLARMKGRSIVPMTESARAALSHAKSIAASDHVIEHGGKPIARVSKALKAAAQRAGMPWVSPHVLRHSAAVWMAEAGVPMPEIAQYLGHADSRITEKVYARFSPNHLRRAAAALETGSFAPAITMFQKRKT